MSADWVSRAEAARLLKVAQPRINVLVDTQRLDVNAEGAVSLVSIQTYASERKKKGKSSAWKMRYERARAKLKEIEVAKANGTLLESALVKRDLKTAFETCRQRLLEIPTALAPTLVGITDPESVREKLEAKIRECLESIARKVPDAPEAPNS